MHDSSIEAINKLNISMTVDTPTTHSPLRILWLSAFCYENKDSLNFRPHNHTFFEVHFVTQGNICYRFDDSEADVSAGNFVLIPPLCIHCIVGQSADFEKITISFEADESTDVFASLNDMTKHTCETGEDIGTSLDFIARRAKQKTAYSDSIVKSRLEEIIYLIASASAHRPLVLTETVYDPRLLKAKKFIEDNPHIFLSCDEVAQYSRLSPKQLGRLFRQYENCSLLDFIHGQKIEAAKKMIRETDELFETISERLGFSSVNYFGKFFIRCTGMTPGEYRRIQCSK